MDKRKAGSIMTTTLETERLLIRNFSLGDWQALHEMINQYESSGLAAYDQQWPASPEEIKGIAQWFAGGDSYLAVCLKETGRLIGFLSLNAEKQVPSELNIGYIFNFDDHGKGYATEACRAALTHAFVTLQAQQVVSGTAAANHASCRLLEKLGFTRTAESACSFRKTPDGKPIEFVGYSYTLTREKWEGVDKRQTV
jgi:[ribosomal protein S5]-alanine N-acetyltransferase